MKHKSARELSTGPSHQLLSTTIRAVHFPQRLDLAPPLYFFLPPPFSCFALTPTLAHICIAGPEDLHAFMLLRPKAAHKQHTSRFIHSRTNFQVGIFPCVPATRANAPALSSAKDLTSAQHGSSCQYPPRRRCKRRFTYPLPTRTDISTSLGQVLSLQVRLEIATSPSEIGVTNQINYLPGCHLCRPRLKAKAMVSRPLFPTCPTSPALSAALLPVSFHRPSRTFQASPSRAALISRSSNLHPARALVRPARSHQVLRM